MGLYLEWLVEAPHGNYTVPAAVVECRRLASVLNGNI